MVAHQAPLFMGFLRQEYWSRLPCPPPRALPDLETEPASPVSPAFQADSLSLSHQGSPTKEYYLAIKKNELMPFAAIWLDLEVVILSEVRERQISYGISYM